jgi:hypothetical protein
MRVIFAILCLIAMSVLVSFGLSAFICGRFIAITDSVFITELLLLILWYYSVASSSDAPEIIGLPVILAIISAPIIFITSLTCVAITIRLRRAKTPQ